MLPTVVLADEALTRKADAFTAKAQINFISCATSAQSEASNAAFMRQPINSKKIKDCVDKAKAERDPEFSELKKTLAKNKGASEALKAHYAYWLSSMDGMNGGIRGGEVLARSSKLDELGNRLSLEVR